MGSDKPAGIVVTIAQKPEDVAEALEFCGAAYEKEYGTHWNTPPDLFFVARENHTIVATGGLTFAALHPQIASEKYFQLTDGMRYFINTHRDSLAEFGRFSSLKKTAAKAILHSALSYCALVGVDFLFAWANPSVYKYTSEKLGIKFWPIAVPLDLDNALSDTRWASPPVGFFQRKDPPSLHLGVVPFWENAAAKLAAESPLPAGEPSWLPLEPQPLAAAPLKPTSIYHGAPRLLRSARARGAIPQSGTMPRFPGVDTGRGIPKGR